MRLRACKESDLPAIRDIAGYYVNNTVITLATEPPTCEDIERSWHASMSLGLPYMVAVDHREKVLAFSSIGPFRGGGGRAGYRHTVELSLFCHPDHVREGIGSMLLTRIIEVLRRPEAFPNIITKPRSEDNKVRTLLACMSIDDTTWQAGLGLRDFYVKHDFVEVGHMRRVGHKFGRW